RSRYELAPGREIAYYGSTAAPTPVVSPPTRRVFMDLFTVWAILLALTAACAYVNDRYIGLPITIGVMLIALGCSLVLNVMEPLGLVLEERAVEAWLRRIDFNR